MLSTVQGKPMDYSKMEKFAKTREAQAKRDLAAGMALSMMGGETLQPLGGKIFTKALAEGGPLRVQTQDSGFVDPASGEFIENPVAARSREERVIEGRLNSRIREEENKARIALAQGNAAAADAAKSNAEALRLIALGIAQQNADTNRFRAGTAADKANKPEVGRPLVGSEERPLTELATQRDILDKLIGSYKDEFASGFGPLGEAKMMASRQAGGALEAGARMLPKSLGGKAAQDSLENTRKMNEWFAEYRRQIENPQRHALFGATLTGNEKEEWNKTAVTTGMEARTVKEKLARQKQIIENELKKKADVYRQKGSMAASQVDAITGSPAAPASDDDLINKYLK
jgi:hypothetical protein